MEPSVVFEIQAGPIWDWRVAMDLFLGGAGVGAMLFAVFLDERFGDRYRRMAQSAAVLGPVLVLAGLALIMLKLGRPLHAWNAYTHFNPTSPMWWGGVFQPLAVGLGVVYAWAWFRPEGVGTSMRRWIGRVLTPFALIVGAYHGLLLSVMVSLPLWNTGPTVIFALLGFAATGIAVVLLVHLVRMKVAGRLDDEAHVGRVFDGLRVVRNTLVALLVLQIGTAFLWWLSLRLGSQGDRLALEAANEAYGGLFWYFGVGLGLVVPLVLGAVAVALGEERHRRLQISTIALTSALILLGGYCFRLALVLGGQVAVPVQVF